MKSRLRGAHTRHGIAVVMVAAALAIAGCATARPEKTLTATTEDGHLVPLDSVTISYDVGGVHVIQRPSFGNDVVSVHLYLLGGTRQLTPATQGIEKLLLWTSEYGTSKYPGDATRAAWARTGSQLLISPDDDWTLFGFRGIRQEFDSSWNVFAERLMHPTLASKSVELVRSQLIGGIRQRSSDPDSYAMTLADSVAFAGHPYGLQTGGTEATLTSLDSAALARYVATQMVTSRMLLVVVGNLSRTQLEPAVARTLAKLPAGSYVWTLPAPLPASPTSVTLVERPVATDYILGLFQGPPASERDYAALRVATALLSSRMHSEIREDRGLSYAASAPYIERGIGTGAVYVTTSSPDKVLPLIRKSMDDLRNLDWDGYSMRYFTDQFIMDYLAENMTSSAQADFLARAQLYHGDYHQAGKSMEELRHLTSNQLRTVSRRYFKNIHFVYLGDTARVMRSSFADF
jgi:Predicted Zn-dependent peptidases